MCAQMKTKKKIPGDGHDEEEGAHSMRKLDITIDAAQYRISYATNMCFAVPPMKL